MPLDEPEPLLALSAREALTAEAVFERMFPADEDGPGAGDRRRHLPGPGSGGRVSRAVYLSTAGAGVARSAPARTRFGAGFASAAEADQDELLGDLERGESRLGRARAASFFELLRSHLQEGLFSDPAYGGNRDKLGWRLLGHPGVWLENSAEENLSADPVTKGGRIQSLADVAAALQRQQGEERSPDSIPQRGAAPPAERAMSSWSASAAWGVHRAGAGGAGLKVVGLEAGPYWRLEDFQPDELGATYYCRAEMGPKFKARDATLAPERIRTDPGSSRSPSAA